MQIHISKRKELFIKSMIYLGVFAVLGIISISLLKSRFLGIVSLILMFLPLVSIPFLLKKYTTKMEINFYPDYFITCFDNEFGIENKLHLKDIKSYTIQFPNDNFRSLRLDFYDHRKIEYTFFEKQKFEGDIDSTELIKSFHLLVQQYNLSNVAHSKIIYKPNFYATRLGLYVIIFLCVLLLFSIFLYSVHFKKNIPITFLFSFILIVQLVMKRKKGLEYFRKVRNGDFS